MKKKKHHKQSPREALDQALALAGVSRYRLSKLLGHTASGAVNDWAHGRRKMGMEVWAGILDAIGLSGGYDTTRGWWVARPEDVTLPPGA